MSIKAIIVDDEFKVAKSLQNTLERNIKDVEVVGLAHDAPSAYDMIKSSKPDLIFLDIVMPEESGFDLIQKFEEIDFEIIFVTSHDEFALQAFKCCAIGYILKPVSIQELVDVIELTKSRLNQKSKSKMYESLIHNINTEDNQEHKIAIVQSMGTQYVKVKDIIRCEGWLRYTKIFLQNEKPIGSSYNIGKFSKLLEPYSFIQIHRSHLINKSHVVKILNGDYVLMSDKMEIPISTRRKGEVVREIS